MNSLRYAVRTLLKSPGFTLTALLTLALGIGVNTAMFSLVDELLLRQAPFPDGGRIHQILAETRNGKRYSYSEAEVREIREKAASFDRIAVIRYKDCALAEPDRPAESVQGVLASAELFEVCGTQPFLGRAFTPAEALPGRNQVVVLSYAFWQQRFGGNRDIVGRTLRLDGESVTVIGVMPAAFGWRLLWGETTFWRPLNYTPDQLKSRTNRPVQLIGHLKPGATVRSAMAELAPVAAVQLKDFPRDYNGLTYLSVPLHEAQMDDEGRSILSLLLGLSGFVLLLACANLANLQLARATMAMRDFAIRAALGASRAQLIRQQLVECLLLALAGGSLGAGVGYLINRALSAAIYINNEAGGLDLPLNGPILLFTFLVAAGAGLLFGIVPAWLSSRTDVVTALKTAARGSTGGRGHHRMRQLLIIGEVTLALVLLGGAAVMQRGFDRFLGRDVGWDKGRVLSGQLSLPEARFPTPESRLEFFRQVEARLSVLPGVERVALATSLPIWGFGSSRKVLTEKMGSADEANLPMSRHVMVTAGLFEVLGMPLVAGRGFAPDIKADDPKVIVINQSLARQLWPGQDPLGQRLATLNNGTATWSEVIGVVRDTQSAADISNERIPGQVFRPMAHEPWSSARFAVRAANPEALRETVRRALAEIDPDLPVIDLQSASSAIERNNRNLRVVAQILGGFALLGLVLAAVGLYGVISNIVAQRTSEFGIRLALGARPADVLGLVMRHGITLTLIGLVLGLGGAYGLSLLLGSIMPRMVAADPVALGGMALALLAVAVLACFLPARRATKVDPLVALRAE